MNKKKKVGRPASFDLMEFLQQHPEHCDSSISVLAREIGVTSESIAYQLGRALFEDKATLGCIIRPKDKFVSPGNSKKLKEITTEAMIERYFSILNDRRRGVDDDDKRRAYQAKYHRERRRKLKSRPTK